MSTEIKMPQLGESVTEGTVGRWLKRPGETVQKYEPLLEIITDKVDTEVPSPVSGTLLELTVAEGETVRVGTVIARIGAADEGETPHRGVSTVAAPANSHNSFLSPVVARMVAEHSLDPAQIAGSGQGGRVTKQDVLRFIEQEAGGRRQEAGDRGQEAESEQPAPVAVPVPAPAFNIQHSTLTLT